MEHIRICIELFAAFLEKNQVFQNKKLAGKKKISLDMEWICDE